jgi:hypothetical protein
MNFQQKVLCSLLSVAVVSGAAHAQHGDHASHGTPSADQIGSENISFATSCKPETADNFNRAVALVYSFWFAEAINTFNAVLAEDADCAIAHWGIALSHWGNPFAGQRNAAQLARGQASIASALNTGSPDNREKMYISAVAELFSDTQGSTQGARTVAYEHAMTALVAAYPDDMEANIFYALAVNQTASPTDKTYSQQLKAAEILEPLFMAYPNHPGLAHYIIHAYDHPPLAERALNAARRYASLAPDAPHALHMPSHTFTRVGMWQESVDTNLRSAQIARARQDAYWTEQIDIQHQAASAWASFAAGNQDQGIRLMSAAADIEDATDKAAVSPGPMAPARELLGMMLLAAGRPAEALTALEATLIKEPNRFVTLSAGARSNSMIQHQQPLRFLTNYQSNLPIFLGQA